jgi:hypothetical protein
MSVKQRQFGAVSGVFGQDARIFITGPGAKQSLAMIASYIPSTITQPNSLFYAGVNPQILAQNAMAVWGRLLVFDTLVDPPGEVTALDAFTARAVFDQALPGPGPHKFLFPLRGLVPGPKSTTVLSIIQTQIPDVTDIAPGVTISWAPLLTVYGEVSETDNVLNLRG